MLNSNILEFSKSRYASRVVESAIINCSINDRNIILNKLSNVYAFYDLLLSKFGVYVARTIIKYDKNNNIKQFLTRDAKKTLQIDNL